ncbi:MAG: hypothetical protein RSB04_08990 [Gordonibacter sp.]
MALAVPRFNLKKLEKLLHAFIQWVANALQLLTLLPVRKSGLLWD